MKPLNRDLSLILSMYDDIANIKDNEKLILTIFEKLHDFYNMSLGGIAVFNKKRDTLGFIVGKFDHFDSEKNLTNLLIWHQVYAIDSLPFRINLNDTKIISVDGGLFYSFRKEDPLQPDIEKVMHNMGFSNFLLVPMRTGGELLGFLILPFSEYTFTEEDTEYLLKISNLIATTLKNAFAFEEIKRKNEEKEMQIRFLNLMDKIEEEEFFLLKIAHEITTAIPSEYISVYIATSDNRNLSTLCCAKDSSGELRNINMAPNLIPAFSAMKSKIFSKNITNHIELFGEEFEGLCAEHAHLKQLKEKYSIASILVAQFSITDMGEINLFLGRNTLHNSRKDHFAQIWENKTSFFSRSDIEFSIQFLPQLALILASFYAFDEIKKLSRKLEQEKNYLLDEINLTNNFQEIIGSSMAIQKTLLKVKQVAPLDVTVLIQGETGTGKELIARAVHNLSKRNEKAFITVNCAALPSQLIESELFGHEKGSFTGAVEKRIGKFEVADGGTIFLDEIGELPLEIQAKLLRVLQEKEFERLGGKSIIHTNVRIVAATNRDLEKEVAFGKFRADLFFRLNVFPILVPPLRDRDEDIPLLVKFFTDKYSKKLGKTVSSIRKSDMDMLTNYSWPGNVRELEHVAERAVIVSSGQQLVFENISDGLKSEAEPDLESFRTLKEIETEHIMYALRAAKGKVTGEKSASQLLGINGKTLGSKMKKLNIRREIIIASQDK